MLLITILCILCILAFLHLFSKPKEGLSCSYGNAFDLEHVSYYDTLVYDGLKQRQEMFFLDPILQPNSIVLDVGSGTGHFVNAIHEKGHQVTGVDSSNAMIQYAKKKYSHDYLLGDVTNTSLFSNDSFSHICCLYYTIYYFNKARFFQNAYEWLMPDGYLIVHLSKEWKYGPTSKFRGPFTYSSSHVYDKHHEFITVNKKRKRFEHKIKWESISSVISIAKQYGFTVHSIYSYPLPYHGEFLYVFYKSH
jgi:SAM-dependent methyltransferase